MNPYNGFSGEQRLKSWHWMLKEMKEGRCPQPKPKCECCGNEGYTEYHTEDYSEPFDKHIYQYTVCYRCHMWIHCRYRNHKGFKTYVDYLRAGSVFKPFGNKDWYRFRNELQVMPIPSHGGTPREEVYLLDDLLKALLSGE
jgi:hypothetical protein